MKRPVYDLLWGTWKSKNEDVEEIFSFWQYKDEVGFQSDRYSHQTIKAGKTIYQSPPKVDFSSFHIGDYSTPLIIIFGGNGEFMVSRINEKELHLVKMDNPNIISQPLLKYVLEKSPMY